MSRSDKIVDFNSPRQAKTNGWRRGQSLNVTAAAAEVAVPVAEAASLQHDQLQ